MQFGPGATFVRPNIPEDDVMASARREGAMPGFALELAAMALEIFKNLWRCRVPGHYMMISCHTRKKFTWIFCNFLLSGIFLGRTSKNLGHVEYQDGHVLSLLDVNPTGTTELFKLTW